jgi:hypothetical protein
MRGGADAMKVKIISLAVGVLFILVDFLVNYVSLLGSYGFWFLMKFMVWPMIFIIAYRTYAIALRKMYSIFGVFLGLFIASFFFMGEGDFFDAVISILSYLTYSAGFFSTSLILIFLIFGALKDIFLKSGRV